MCDLDGINAIPVIIGDGVSQLSHSVPNDMTGRLILLDWRDRGNLTVEVTSIDEQRGAVRFQSLAEPIISSPLFNP